MLGHNGTRLGILLEIQRFPKQIGNILLLHVCDGVRLHDLLKFVVVVFVCVCWGGGGHFGKSELYVCVKRFTALQLSALDECHL